MLRSTFDNDSDQAPADVAVIEPPPEMQSFVDATARIVSQNVMEIEKLMMTFNERNSKFSFLWSSDPFHAFYQQKLAVYLAREQDATPMPRLDPVLLGALSSGITGNYYPPGRRSPLPKFTDLFPEETTIDLTPSCKELDPPLENHRFPYRFPTHEELGTVKLTAQFVARYGMCFSLALANSGSMDSRFNFMNPDDDRFGYFYEQAAAYSKVLALCEKPKNDTAFSATVIDGFFSCLRGETVEYHMGMIDLNSGIDYFASMENLVIPQGITLKELDTIKVTAKFVARYGMDFWLAAENRNLDSKFGFMKQGARGFDCFNILVAAYSKVLTPSENLRDGTARPETVVDALFHRVGRFEKVQEVAKRDGMGDAMVCLNVFVGSVDLFVHLDDADWCPIMPPPEHISVLRTLMLSGMPSMGMMQGPPMPGMSPQETEV